MDRAGNLDHQAAHTDNAPVNLDLVELSDLFCESLHFLKGSLESNGWP
jgi:hypothetical protein